MSVLKAVAGNTGSGGGGGGTVQSVTGLNTNNADPTNPVVQISVDGVTVTGAGTPASPLVAVTGGGGTVSNVSVTNANGFAGSVANPTTTPAITLNTTLTGIIKGNGTALSVAAAGTDYTNAAFKTFLVSGQDDVVADSASDILTLAAGSNVTITTNGTTDTITISSSNPGGTVTSVSGTTNRITSTGGNDPVIDIAATYVGQTSITTVGTIATGVWQGTKIGLAYGGTNADLSGTGGTSQVLRQSTAGAAVTVSQLAASDLSNGTTGSGAVALATSPALITPALGVPSQGNLTNCTNLPISTGVSGLGTGVATFLATPSSANLASAVTDETGSGSLVFATSPAFITPTLGVPANGNLTNCTNLPISTGVSGLGSNVATFLATPSSANLASAVTDETGSGALVFATSPALITPTLGVPANGNLTNCTNLPISTGVSGLGSNVATFLATPSSANLASAVTDETGSGSLVFATSPTFITPALGKPSAGDLGNCTDLPLDTIGSTQGQILYRNATVWTVLSPGVSGQFLKTNGAAANPAWADAAGGGTVTSVALTAPGGFSVSGSPITSSGTIAIVAAGTSGGVPYYSSGTTMASSAALAANGVVVGGGAGATPATTPMTVSSTGAVAAYLGTINAQSGTTYTVQASDTGKIVELNNASAITVTMPNSLSVGFCAILSQMGAGQVTLSPAAGATLRSASSFTKTRAQYAGLTVYVTSNTTGTAATYVIFGDGAA